MTVRTDDRIRRNTDRDTPTLRGRFEQAIQIDADKGGSVSVVVWENGHRTQLGCFDDVPDAERYRDAVVNALVQAAGKQAA